MGKDSDDWYDLPRPAAGIRLYQIRDELREKNLHDTEEPPLENSTAPPGGEAYNVRTSDGTYNDLKCPRMGSAGMRFGRNVPLSEAFPDTANLLTPSPRQVSLELLTRTTFQPATILNVIAAAWIQFMVHDWFVHKKGSWTHTHDIPLDDGDSWHERPCACRRRRPIRRRSPTRNGRRPTSTRTRTGGTARTSMAAARRPRRRSAPAARARCWSARAGGSAWIRSRAGRSPDSPRTAGWD